MDYPPRIVACTRCGRDRWDGPAPVCGVCQMVDEAKDRRRERQEKDAANARFVLREDGAMTDGVNIAYHRHTVEQLETETRRLRAAARSILWMAEKYAEGGGSNGPEMQDYRAAAEIISED